MTIHSEVRDYSDSWQRLTPIAQEIARTMVQLFPNKLVSLDTTLAALNNYAEDQARVALAELEDSGMAELISFLDQQQRIVDHFLEEHPEYREQDLTFETPDLTSEMIEYILAKQNIQEFEVDSSKLTSWQTPDNVVLAPGFVEFLSGLN